MDKFQEHDIVISTKDLEDIPVGTKGTVVYVHATWDSEEQGGGAYIVEFNNKTVLAYGTDIKSI